MKVAKVFAPAKVNLTLHVTGQRADGYHLLDSLVMFADIGDRLTLHTAEANSLQVTGPMAHGVPTGPDNLAMRAAQLFDQPVAITLSKHLPMAAGIGGGSSDAAAVALGLADLTGSRDLPEGLGALGADIRVCLTRRAARMQGVGELVRPLPNLGELHAVLANPGVSVATPDVFKALKNKQNPPMPSRIPENRKTGKPENRFSGKLIEWIAAQRNDLEPPACALTPEIAVTLDALRALPDAALVRMSGSGATCFALFHSRDEAQNAASLLAVQKPDWWVSPVTLT
ncbi:MAG TPA: 4-(cytidine 5'-diphospho)-2-C-methyl-D-erythritol kinase [Aliiroseovarius sp.]|nr:4-(cytidine 5'-diphospho)-2-C-methyl-D-erythritol kinase [Aliiroseovarius sp.]